MTTKVAAVRRLLSLCSASLFLLSSCGDEKLGSSRGSLGLELCDRGDQCGCGIVEPQGTTIDFGSPEADTTARRVLTLRNENAPRPLTITSISIEDDSEGNFGIASVQVFESSAADAAVSSHDFENGPLQLANDGWAEVILGFAPTAAGEATATLRVRSDSDVRSDWSATLRGGSGSSTVCVDPADPSSCASDSLVDFGTLPDTVLGAFHEEEKTVTVSNTGQSEVFVRVELTDDGIPETRPSELVGEVGVFAIGALPCTVLAPGESLTIPVFYRPFVAGDHVGSLTVLGIGEPVVVELRGRVTGPHICFRTEDEIPTDALLQFGDPPVYSTPQNVTETRSIFVSNCGYDAELSIDSVSAATGSSPEFTSASLPWTPQTLAVGDEIEIQVEFAPSAAAGSPATARWLFETNDGARPTTAVDLNARVGPAQRCALVSTVTPLDFGWVAEDEENVGCVPGTPFCAGNGEVSRKVTFRLVNAGQLDCTDINLSSVIPAASRDHFSISANPNGNGFTLAAGETSEEIEVLFSADSTTDPLNYAGRLPYTSPDLLVSPLEIPMKARGGGSPNCAIAFDPVSPPNLFCPDSSLNFGSVNIGQEKTINLRIKNVGSQECEIRNLRRRTGTNASFTFPSNDFSLPVGQIVSVPVSFEPIPPSGTNPFEEFPILCGFNAIEMDVNSAPDGGFQVEAVALAGKGTRPDIDVIPGEVNFGQVTVGCCSEERRVAIYNSGDGTLSLNQLSVLASSDPGFTITQMPTDTELAPGESTEFFVRYCASNIGDSSGIVEIESTDDNEEIFTVAMTGVGTTDSEGFDNWMQPERPTVDVLWVIDDSGSMSDEQDDLANNFNSFITSAVSLNTDYNLGVVNTDAESEWAGKLHHCDDSNRFIRWTQPAAQQQSQFACWARTTASGRPNSDTKESPLQAARLALDYPNVDDYNAGFLREEATLYVILVTDEKDQSDGPVDLYVDFFRNLKGIGNPDLLNISAISGPPPNGCATADSNDYDYDAVSTVGGQFRSICTADWSDLITNLGLDVFNARRQFPLSRPATASTIVVSVCDPSGTCTAVPQDGTNGWTFNSSANAVTFHGSAIPGPGETIDVEYIAICF